MTHHPHAILSHFSFAFPVSRSFLTLWPSRIRLALPLPAPPFCPSPLFRARSQPPSLSVFSHRDRNRECSLFFFLSLLCVGGAWCEDGTVSNEEGAESGGGSDGVERGEVKGKRGGDGGGEERRSDTTRGVRKRSVHILVRDIPANIPGARSSLSLFSLFLSLFPSHSLSIVCFSLRFSPFLSLSISLSHRRTDAHAHAHAPSLPLSPSLFGVSARPRDPREIYARASEMIIYKA